MISKDFLPLRNLSCAKPGGSPGPASGPQVEWLDSMRQPNRNQEFGADDRNKHPSPGSQRRGATGMAYGLPGWGKKLTEQVRKELLT